MTIISRGRFCRTATVYFDEEPDRLDADVLSHVERSQPLAGAQCEPFPTIVVDLTRDVAALEQGLGETTRYKVRRAAREGLVYEAWERPPAEVVDAFARFYADFAARKALPPLEGDYPALLARAGALQLSAVRASQTIVSWYGYYRTRARVLSLWMPSSVPAPADAAARALVGRANRYHVWRDMLRCRDAGVAIYDMCGWYPGGADAARLRINAFKAEFGGTVVMTFNCRRALTPRGRLVLWLDRQRGRARRVRERGGGAHGRPRADMPIAG